MYIVFDFFTLVELDAGWVIVSGLIPMLHKQYGGKNI